MKIINLLATVFVLLLISAAGTSLGETTSILTSDNEADLASSEIAAEFSGSSLVETEWGTLAATSLEKIISENPDKVLIIGGPIAIPTNTELALNAIGITTIRISGADRYATSSEIARYFWEASAEVILVDGYDSEAIAEAIAQAKEKKVPILFTKSTTIPNSVKARIGSLGATEIQLHTTPLTTTETIEAEASELGANVNVPKAADPKHSAEVQLKNARKWVEKARDTINIGTEIAPEPKVPLTLAIGSPISGEEVAGEITVRATAYGPFEFSEYMTLTVRDETGGTIYRFSTCEEVPAPDAGKFGFKCTYNLDASNHIGKPKIIVNAKDVEGNVAEASAWVKVVQSPGAEQAPTLSFSLREGARVFGTTQVTITATGPHEFDVDEMNLEIQNAAGEYPFPIGRGICSGGAGCTPGGTCSYKIQCTYSWNPRDYKGKAMLVAEAEDVKGNKVSDVIGVTVGERQPFVWMDYSDDMVIKKIFVPSREFTSAKLNILARTKLDNNRCSKKYKYKITLNDNPDHTMELSPCDELGTQYEQVEIPIEPSWLIKNQHNTFKIEKMGGHWEYSILIIAVDTKKDDGDIIKSYGGGSVTSGSLVMYIAYENSNTFCTDSDGGVDVNVRGVCEDERGTFPDRCLDGGDYVSESFCMTEDMVEYCKQENSDEYCDNLPRHCYKSSMKPMQGLAWSYFPRDESYFCENGCENGVCIGGSPATQTSIEITSLRDGEEVARGTLLTIKATAKSSEDFTYEAAIKVNNAEFYTEMQCTASNKDCTSDGDCTYSKICKSYWGGTDSVTGEIPIEVMIFYDNDGNAARDTVTINIPAEEEETYEDTIVYLDSVMVQGTGGTTDKALIRVAKGDTSEAKLITEGTTKEVNGFAVHVSSAGPSDYDPTVGRAEIGTNLFTLKKGTKLILGLSEISLDSVDISGNKANIKVCIDYPDERGLECETKPVPARNWESINGIRILFSGVNPGDPDPNETVIDISEAPMYVGNTLPVECIQEGQSRGSTNLLCCEGLTGIGMEFPGSAATCTGHSSDFYCTNCGDGTCTHPENACNCQADCQPETTSTNRLYMILEDKASRKRGDLLYRLPDVGGWFPMASPKMMCGDSTNNVYIEYIGATDLLNTNDGRYINAVKFSYPSKVFLSPSMQAGAVDTLYIAAETNYGISEGDVFYRNLASALVDYTKINDTIYLTCDSPSEAFTIRTEEMGDSDVTPDSPYKALTIIYSKDIFPVSSLSLAGTSTKQTLIQQTETVSWKIPTAFVSLATSTIDTQAIKPVSNRIAATRALIRAEKLLTQAEAAYESGNYKDAYRLAIAAKNTAKDAMRLYRGIHVGMYKDTIADVENEVDTIGYESVKATVKESFEEVAEDYSCEYVEDANGNKEYLCKAT